MSIVRGTYICHFIILWYHLLSKKQGCHRCLVNTPPPPKKFWIDFGFCPQLLISSVFDWIRVQKILWNELVIKTALEGDDRQHSPTPGCQRSIHGCPWWNHHKVSIFMTSRWIENIAQFSNFFQINSSKQKDTEFYLQNSSKIEPIQVGKRRPFLLVWNGLQGENN